MIDYNEVCYMGVYWYVYAHDVYIEYGNTNGLVVNNNMYRLKYVYNIREHSRILVIIIGSMQCNR